MYGNIAEIILEGKNKEICILRRGDTLMKNIRWNNDIQGYLSEQERKECHLMESLLDKIRKMAVTDIHVEISIDGGNQFAICNNQKGPLKNYMSAQECVSVLRGIYIGLNLDN